mgnify:CR=1 FL=1
MQENIIKSYEYNRGLFLHWVRMAGQDIGKWVDEKECIRSLSTASEYYGRARMCAQILYHEFGLDDCMQEIRNMTNVLEVARERVIKAI